MRSRFCVLSMAVWVAWILLGIPGAGRGQETGKIEEPQAAPTGSGAAKRPSSPVATPLRKRAAPPAETPVPPQKKEAAAEEPTRAAKREKPAPAPAAHSLGAVHPSNLVLPELAISSFDGDPGGVITQTVQNDMFLADIATKPRNGPVADAAAIQDRKAGCVNLDGWAAAGVHYVLRGVFHGSTAEAEFYDVASKQRLFGKSYNGITPPYHRRLAHQISDDIMAALTNRPGIFSTLICYLSDCGRARKEVAVMDADGANGRTLTQENAQVATPCWGMNGTEIYFTSYRDNNPDLYGVTLAGNRFEVSRRPGLNISPSWNEITRRLAVCLSKDGNSEIYTMDRKGQSLARLTNTPDAETAPEWSPDGSRLAFTSDRGGSPQIYIMDANGGPAQCVTSGSYFDSPSWSPDGSKLAFVSREAGEFNIYVADLAGGAPARQLTHGQRDNRDPGWAPDSKHLAFCSNRTGRNEVFMMNTDTKTAHQLTHSGTGASSPAWSAPFK